MLKDCKDRNATQQPTAGVFLRGKRQLHKPSRTTTTSITNLDRETQKIQKRLAKPLIARLKNKWNKKKKSPRYVKQGSEIQPLIEIHVALDTCSSDRVRKNR
ncbi:hypothetical protein HN011_011090 [Eciton burchellii]|nr:hypothetical protein HN011_011090 [Eciton burchellii]